MKNSMKHLYTLLIIISQLQLYAQSEKNIVADEHYKLNGQVNKDLMGGKARIAIPLTLPANTTGIIYAIKSSTNKSNNGLKLASQLVSLTSGMALASMALDAVASNVEVENDSPTPINVYVVDNIAFARNFEQYGNQWRYSLKASRTRVTSAVVGFEYNTKNTKTIYLCIENVSDLYSSNITLSATAALADYEQSNGWSPTRKQEIYDALYKNLKKSYGADKASELSGCIIEAFTNGYTQAEIKDKANYEVESILKKISNKCLEELGLK